MLSPLKASLRKGLVKLASSAGYELVPSKALHRRALVSHLREVFDTYRIDCVLDVGANRGQYYEMLRREVGFEGVVISFEPVRRHVAELQRLASGERRWEIVDVALGSDDATAQMNVASSPGCSSLLAPRSDVVKGFWTENSIAGVETVRVRTLDGLMGDLQARHHFGAPYLKLDTQGYDLHVVRGAARSLQQVRALQTEASIRPIYDGMPDYLHTLSTISGLGFEVSGMFPVASDRALRLIEFDCVMVNPDFADHS